MIRKLEEFLHSEKYVWITIEEDWESTLINGTKEV